MEPSIPSAPRPASFQKKAECFSRKSPAATHNPPYLAAFPLAGRRGGLAICWARWSVGARANRPRPARQAGPLPGERAAPRHSPSPPPPPPHDPQAQKSAALKAHKGPALHRSEASGAWGALPVSESEDSAKGQSRRTNAMNEWTDGRSPTAASPLNAQPRGEAIYTTSVTSLSTHVDVVFVRR